MALDITNGDHFCYFMFLFLGLFCCCCFAFGFDLQFMYLRLGVVGVPFPPCRHRFFQNSILSSLSRALLHASGWKTKAQMSQVSLQLKFPT